MPLQIFSMTSMFWSWDDRLGGARRVKAFDGEF
jgi:hypothetical protein